MNCPPPIADIFLDILRTGILWIRATDDGEFTTLLADHLHNIPSLLKNYRPELLKFYWEIERPSFIRRCEEAGFDKAGFEPQWQCLQSWIENQKPAVLVQ